MSQIVAVILGILGWALPHLVARVLLSLGIGVVSYIGMGIVLDYVFDQGVQAFSGLPLQALQLAALCKVDVAMNIVTGAVNARLGMLSLNGIVSRFNINPAAAVEG